MVEGWVNKSLSMKNAGHSGGVENNLLPHILKKTGIKRSNPELSMNHIKRRCCSYFGCGKQLTLQESLQGERCINHPKTSKTINIGKL